MEPDELLLAAWRGGDGRAGRTLFTRHVDGVSRFFLSKVASGVDDLVQRSFLALLERSGEIPAGVPVRAYLFGIARNLLLRRSSIATASSTSCAARRGPTLALEGTCHTSLISGESRSSRCHGAVGEASGRCCGSRGRGRVVARAAPACPWAL